MSFSGNQLLMNQIDYNLINRFANHLLIEGVSKNSVAVYLRAIRAIVNRAAKEGSYDLKNEPFRKYCYWIEIYVF